jgi:hypothetical protein
LIASKQAELHLLERAVKKQGIGNRE